MMAKQNFTDMVVDGWVHKIPEGIQPYVHLMRLDRPVGIWLLLLPGLCSILLASGGVMRMTAREWGLAALFTVGAVIMRGAGCVINDLWDRDLDAQISRTRQRPLASGQMSARGALIVLAVLLALGLAILLRMNGLTIALGVLSMPFVVAYPLFKRFTDWPQAFLGLTFNFGGLMGWSAVTGALAPPAFALYLGGIFWTLGYDTVYAHQDKEDDALVGVHSTALIFKENAKRWVAGFYAVALVCLAAALFLVSGNVMLVIMAVCGMGVHLIWQLRRWDMSDQESALRVFRSNRDFGLIAAFFFALCSV